MDGDDSYSDEERILTGMLMTTMVMVIKLLSIRVNMKFITVIFWITNTVMMMIIPLNIKMTAMISGMKIIIAIQLMEMMMMPMIMMIMLIQSKMMRKQMEIMMTNMCFSVKNWM